MAEKDKAKPQIAPQSAPAEPVAAAPRPAASKTKTAQGKAPQRKTAPKVDTLAETKARNKKALADALARVQAVKMPPADEAAIPARPAAPARNEKAGKAVKADKAAKAPKPKKVKLVRESFRLPEREFEAIPALKDRLSRLDAGAKKSEILRAGLLLLKGLDDAALKAAMAGVERIKTGRPPKK